MATNFSIPKELLILGVITGMVSIYLIIVMQIKQLILQILVVIVVLVSEMEEYSIIQSRIKT